MAELQVLREQLGIWELRVGQALQDLPALQDLQVDLPARPDRPDLPARQSQEMERGVSVIATIIDMITL